jgi:kynurenine formamidase
MPADQPPLWDRLRDAEVVELSHLMATGMPQSPNHVPYRLILDRRHGDVVQDDGGSMANEVLVMSGHIGTHVDALGHVSFRGRLTGGADVATSQSQAGLSRLGIDEFVPFLGRCVILDVTAVHGVTVLPPAYEVTAADLVAAGERAGVTIRPGDAVFIATGWSHNWGDYTTFVGVRDGVPGPGEEAALWLAAQRPAVVGAETVAFEQIKPGLGHSLLPAHRVLLQESAINIVEMLDLTTLVERGVHECTLVLNPLRLAGATGAPVRALALL